MSESQAMDARFPLVRQGMIDAVQAAGHYAFDQQGLQRILQAALEWQERNGCTCCRVARAVDRLAHELAYAHTAAAVECASLMDRDEWMCLDGLEDYEKEGIERDFLYLDQRGLIERHPEKKDWFRVRDESEAAIVLQASTEKLLHRLTARELVERAVRGCRDRKSRKGVKHPRWVAIHDTFGLGSSYSHDLCRLFGLDPDEEVKR